MFVNVIEIFFLLSFDDEIDMAFFEGKNNNNKF